jgi:hypothetical protein
VVARLSPSPLDCRGSSTSRAGCSRRHRARAPPCQSRPRCLPGWGRRRNRTQGASRRFAFQPRGWTRLRAFPCQFRRASTAPLLPIGRPAPASSGEALRSATPPARRTPRGALRAELKRCICPTCAMIDLPYEHPIGTARLSPPARGKRVALDGAPPASEHPPHDQSSSKLHASASAVRVAWPRTDPRRTYRRLLAKPRAARLRTRRCRRVPRASEDPSGAPCRTRAREEQAPPEPEPRTAVPVLPSRRAALSARSAFRMPALSRLPASAIENSSRARPGIA